MEKSLSIFASSDQTADIPSPEARSAAQHLSCHLCCVQVYSVYSAVQCTG